MSTRTALWPVLFSLFPLSASAATEVSCALEQGGLEMVVSVRAETDALGGSWTEMGRFRLRALLAAPPGKSAWLLVEVHAKAADGDSRIVSSQKVFSPFATGRVEVVETLLGRSLRYECRGAQ